MASIVQFGTGDTVNFSGRVFQVMSISYKKLNNNHRFVLYTKDIDMQDMRSICIQFNNPEYDNIDSFTYTKNTVDFSCFCEVVERLSKSFGSGEPKKCTCETFDVVNFGCKCGGS